MKLELQDRIPKPGLGNEPKSRVGSQSLDWEPIVLLDLVGSFALKLELKYRIADMENLRTSIKYNCRARLTKSTTI